nr:hypothetical protein [Tanacetum cinerariifolium]
MDEENLTMEEYIEMEDEKAHRSDFSVVVFNDVVTTDHKISFEPMISPLDNNQIDFRLLFDEFDDEDYNVNYDKKLFSYKIISVNDLKTDSEDDNDEVNIHSNNVVIELLDNGVDTIDTQSHEFDEDFKTNHDIHQYGRLFDNYRSRDSNGFHEGMPLVFII